MRRLVLAITAPIALVGCQGPVSPTLTAPPQAQATILVAAPSGSTYAGALIGPIVLDIEVVGGVTCYDVKLPSSSDGHGVVWPFGTEARGEALLVPGLTEPLQNGDTFWAGGGSGDSDPALGPCNKPQNYFLGPTASRSNPRETP
jgi:hypothetical protein